MTTYDFHAVNRLGVLLHTFGDLQTARRWVRENASDHDGLHVQSVTVTTVKRVVYRPQIRAVA